MSKVKGQISFMQIKIRGAILEVLEKSSPKSLSTAQINKRAAALMGYESAMQTTLIRVRELVAENQIHNATPGFKTHNRFAFGPAPIHATPVTLAPVLANTPTSAPSTPDILAALGRIEDNLVRFSAALERVKEATTKNANDLAALAAGFGITIKKGDDAA